MQDGVKKSCKTICKTVLGGKGDWKIGKTKMFLKVLPDTSVMDFCSWKRMIGGKSKNNPVKKPVMQMGIQLWKSLIR